MGRDATFDAVWSVKITLELQSTTQNFRREKLQAFVNANQLIGCLFYPPQIYCKRLFFRDFFAESTATMIFQQLP